MKNIIVASTVWTRIVSIGGELKDIEVQGLMKVTLQGTIEKTGIATKGSD
jgi:hypothetical protein